MSKNQNKIKKSILGSKEKNQQLGKENSENKANSIEVIQPDNTSRLTISDRNSRLMSIITITGIILVIISYLFRSMKNIFSSLYINDSIPLGTEHYLLIAIITSLVLTVFYSVYYCYSEFLCFCKYNSDLTLIDFENKANANFKLLLSVLKVNLILCLFAIFLSIPITEIKNYKIAIFVDVIGIIITVLALIKLFRNQSIQQITIPQFICCIGIWIVLGIFILEVGLGVILNINKNSINVVFSDEKDFPLKITQIKNSPEKLDIVIYSNNEKKTVNLNESDLESSFIEVTQETKDDPKQKMVLYDRNYYEYLYTVNLKEYLVEGKNQIEIKFKSNSFPNKINSYRIVNWISYKNDNVSFLKKEFIIDLE